MNNKPETGVETNRGSIRSKIDRVEEKLEEHVSSTVLSFGLGMMNNPAIETRSQQNIQVSVESQDLSLMMES